MSLNTTYFSEKLMELRRSKGWSQEQLGEKLGVTRQTVSKWELGETTPEMEKIIAMSELFGISTDELIKGEQPSDADSASVPLPEQKLAFHKFHYEYKSQRSWRGLPLVHINLGFGGRAKGVIAVGNVACGIFSLGLVSIGVVTVGVVSLGVLILTSVLGLGIFSSGAFAAGLFAAGGAAAGLFAAGGVAAGWVSCGGVAAGTYAFGGLAAASDIGWGGKASGTIAIGKNVDGVVEITEATPSEEVKEIILQQLPDTPGFIVDIVCDLTETMDV